MAFSMALAWHVPNRLPRRTSKNWPEMNDAHVRLHCKQRARAVEENLYLTDVIEEISPAHYEKQESMIYGIEMHQSLADNRWTLIGAFQSRNRWRVGSIAHSYLFRSSFFASDSDSFV